MIDAEVMTVTIVATLRDQGNFELKVGLFVLCWLPVSTSLGNNLG
jgi:hypothetical protein